jgi:RsiW-degrading membrane proteinase PrsW (M82 family)
MYKSQIESDYIGRHFKYYLTVAIFDFFVSIYTQSLKGSLDTAEQLYGFVFLALILYCVYYFGIKKSKAIAFVILGALTLIMGIFDIIDLKNTLDTGTYTLPDSGIDKILVLYDSLVSSAVEFLLLSEIASAILKLNHLTTKSLFSSEIFHHHTIEDVEIYFTHGTPLYQNTLPPSIPSPWLFAWVFIRCFIVYSILAVSWLQFQNIKILPGLMFVGSFAIPFSTLILFFEVNIPNNLSIFRILQLTFIGGVLSILIALFIDDLEFLRALNFLGDSVAGITEEISKAAALLLMLLITKESNFKFRLNALLLGAAVGTGFSVFESAGYSLEDFLNLYNKNSPNELESMNLGLIYLRGVLSPFDHISWTAITSVAIFQMKKVLSGDWDLKIIYNSLKLFTIAILLHMIWDADTPYTLLKYIFLSICSLIIVISEVKNGFEEYKSSTA